MGVIKLVMKDELSGAIVERSIDDSNAMVNDLNAPSGWEGDTMGTVEQITRNLERWILERGNEQHDTILSLIEWEMGVDEITSAMHRLEAVINREQSYIAKHGKKNDAGEYDEVWEDYKRTANFHLKSWDQFKVQRDRRKSMKYKKLLSL